MADSEPRYMVPPVWLEQYFDEHLPAALAAIARLGDAADEPDVPLTRRMRLRRQVNMLRGRLAYRAFRLIAGYEVPDGEDW